MGREGEYPGLKRMYREVMGEDIQKGEHCPVSFGWYAKVCESSRGRGDGY